MLMSCATCKQVAATEADVKRAQQRLAAVRAEERALKAEEAQLVEKHAALTQRHAEVEKQAQQREAASAESQKQHDEVQWWPREIDRMLTGNDACQTPLRPQNYVSSVKWAVLCSGRSA